MMKVISTNMMIQVVGTQQKSVCSFKFPLIVKVNYSTMDSSLVQLSENIESVYNDLTSNTNFSMSRSELAVLQQKLLSGLYVLSPLRVKISHRNDFEMFYDEMLASCPDFAFFPSIDPDVIIAVMPDKGDVLVYMGLSNMLSRLYYGCMPEDEMNEYHSNIINMGIVKRLYRLDCNKPLLGSYISKSKILETMKVIVGDGSICYNLISSYLDIPFVDIDNGSNLSFGNCIPPAGCISWVLENLVLKEIFDSKFTKRFPGVAFSRFMSQIIISSRENDDVSFDEDDIYALIYELGLPGFIESIGPGDDPIKCYKNKMVVLDEDGRVKIMDKDGVIY